MKNKKKKYKCTVCGCYILERKSHEDRSGYKYCTPCFRRLLKDVYNINIRLTPKPSKAERRYKKRKK